MTQVTPKYSVPRRGGLSSDARGVRAAVCHRRGLPSLLGPAPLARGSGVSPVQRADGVGHSPGPVGLRRVCVPALRHRRDDLPGHALPLEPVVPCHLVGNEPEDWRQRPGVAAGPGPGELPHGLDLAPQTPSRHGPPRPRAPRGAGRGGRDLPGRARSGGPRAADAEEDLDRGGRRGGRAGDRAYPHALDPGCFGGAACTRS